MSKQELQIAGWPPVRSSVWQRSTVVGCGAVRCGAQPHRPPVMAAFGPSWLIRHLPRQGGSFAFRAPAVSVAGAGAVAVVAASADANVGVCCRCIHRPFSQLCFVCIHSERLTCNWEFSLAAGPRGHADRGCETAPGQFSSGLNQTQLPSLN